MQGGVWNFDGTNISTSFISQMSQSMERLGPDAETVLEDAGLTLVYRPFHTTRESRLERQPYRSSRGYVLTWDGRLDNRKQLAVALDFGNEPHLTDVEIVAAAFDRWNTDSFRRITGDWAVSIWNPREDELIFAVDYMSIRHLFYRLTENSIWWASDLGPLVLPAGALSIEDEYIAGYFAHDPDSHLTPYREIRQVPAGHYVRVCRATALSYRYWTPPVNRTIRYESDTEYEEHFRELFRQAVARRLRSDTAVLSELSGGVDSSSIVCMGDDILANEGAQTSRLDTISHYDMSETNTDDWEFFHIVEARRGRAGAHLDVGKVGDCPADLEYCDFVSLPGYLSAWRYFDDARAQVFRDGGYRVVLSGIGGDEFMGGIPEPSAQLADALVQLKFIMLAKELVEWGLVKKKPWTHLLCQAAISLLPASLAQHLTKSAEVEPWIGADFAKRTAIATRKLDVKEHFGLRLPTQRSFSGGVLLMANKMAKTHLPPGALEEVRYPYLDQDLVEFLFAIPANQIMRPGERRSLMRRSLSGIVPPEVLLRRTKQFGARTPIAALERKLEEIEQAFKSSLAARLGYINQQCFLEAVRAARNGQRIHIVRMLRAISLEFWLRDLASRALINLDCASVRPTSAVRMEAEHV